MIEKTIMLSDFTRVKTFVSLANSLPYDISLVSGRKKVNGKSIIGIFSLDLTKPVTVIADTDSIAAFSRKIEPYVLKKG